MNIGVIGLGYWGNNLVRNFNNLNSCSLFAIADKDELQLEKFSKLYKDTLTFSDPNQLIVHTEVDAVVIATPVFTHFELAKKALLAGKHVLVEKPMTSTRKEAEELIALAKKNKLTLMVDHTFLYTGAVQEIKNLVLNGTIGNINYIDSTRINLGLFQPDINVLWDLAPHDISIVNAILPLKPLAVNAVGVSHTANGIENIAYLTLHFENNTIAHFNCSWSSPVKIRKFLIGGDKKMIVWDDMEPTEKIKVYDTGYTVKNQEEKEKILIDYRTGNIFIPKINMTEALKLMAEDFITAIKQQSTPLASAENGLFVVKILEAAQESIKNNGQLIQIQ